MISEELRLFAMPVDAPEIYADSMNRGGLFAKVRFLVPVFVIWMRSSEGTTTD